MRVIEPHIHMIARTTADYERMAQMHTVACCEPAFWAGYDRQSAAAFYDYFHHITAFEPTRAAQYLIDHYAYVCMNPKEADNLELAREVISFLPEFLDRPNVLGIGEIGLNRNTRNELLAFEEQLDLAIRPPSARVDSHPPSGRQAQGHPDDARQPPQPARRQSGAHLLRPRRGAYHRPHPRRRLLGRHDHLSGHEELAAPRGGRRSSASAPTT